MLGKGYATFLTVAFLKSCLHLTIRKETQIF